MQNNINWRDAEKEKPSEYYVSNILILSEMVNSNCKRCGKPIITSNRSLFGNNSAHAKWAGICCLTQDELKEMRGGI